MSYLEPKGTSLNIATNTQELRKLIIENPDLPLLIFAGEDAYFDCGFAYTCCSSIWAELGEFLDSYIEEGGSDKIFCDRDELNDIVGDYYYEESDDYIDEKIKSYDPYWKKCIILYVDN